MKLELTAKEARRILNGRANETRKKRAGKPKPPPRVNPKADRGRIRDNAYLAYLRRQTCCVGPLLGDRCEGPTDPAHLRFSDFKVGRINPGKGRKSDDRWCLPVCRKHHDSQHAHGNERAWWSDVVRADPNALAVATYAAFLAGEELSEKSDIPA